MMTDSQATTVTWEEGHAPTVTLEDGDSDEEPSRPSLNLEGYPSIYVLPTHITTDELHEIEDNLAAAGAHLTYNILEARLILGAVATQRRARFEIQTRGLQLESIKSNVSHDTQIAHLPQASPTHSPARKKRKVSDEASVRPTVPKTTSSTESASDDSDVPDEPLSQLSFAEIVPEESLLSSGSIEPVDERQASVVEFPDNHVKVVKIEWLDESIKACEPQPLQQYLLVEGKPIENDLGMKTSALQAQPFLRYAHADPVLNLSDNKTALQHHFVDARSRQTSHFSRYGRRDRNKDAALKSFAGRSFTSSTHRVHSRSQRHLLHETTSEHDNDTRNKLPEMPLWVQENKIYACERSTPLEPINREFVDLLKKIKLARELMGDEIGVRAYSTSIASIAAYPYVVSNVKEILALPGCDYKTAQLFREYQNTGRLKAADEVDCDPVLSVLRDFWNIWGVGAATAREFYYDRGWRDRDDIIEYGWNTISRVQQIGVKYYDEFELKIPRSEVESIASIVTYHAKQLVDDGIECVIVGGYRRGKTECGDVDIILSHRRESATKYLITPLVHALEKAGWITHTLTLTETNSGRNQQTLPLKSIESKHHGFDTLDKALVVWQDPVWPTKEADLASNPKAKNPNVHRRVDVIISPWRTVGCGVAGWTSGITFQRDLRRYARHAKGWKFDSSGVRDRGTARWIDLERWTDEKDRAKTWEEAERRVFEGLGLAWRPPEERNTG